MDIKLIIPDGTIAATVTVIHPDENQGGYKMTVKAFDLEDFKHGEIEVSRKKIKSRTVTDFFML